MRSRRIALLLVPFALAGCGRWGGCPRPSDGTRWVSLRIQESTITIPAGWRAEISPAHGPASWECTLAATPKARPIQLFGTSWESIPEAEVGPALQRENSAAEDHQVTSEITRTPSRDGVVYCAHREARGKVYAMCAKWVANGAGPWARVIGHPIRQFEAQGGMPVLRAIVERSSGFEFVMGPTRSWQRRRAPRRRRRRHGGRHRQRRSAVSRSAASVSREATTLAGSRTATSLASMS